jgi:hypothetical protein
MRQLSRLQLEENGTVEKYFLLPITADTHHAYRVHTGFIRINMANMTLMNILHFSLSISKSVLHIVVFWVVTP